MHVLPWKTYSKSRSSFNSISGDTHNSSLLILLTSFMSATMFTVLQENRRTNVHQLIDTCTCNCMHAYLWGMNFRAVLLSFSFFASSSCRISRRESEWEKYVLVPLYPLAICLWNESGSYIRKCNMKQMSKIPIYLCMRMWYK